MKKFIRKHSKSFIQAEFNGGIELKRNDSYNWVFTFKIWQQQTNGKTSLNIEMTSVMAKLKDSKNADNTKRFGMD